MTLADVFDGVMITFAMYTLNVFNPGALLYRPSADQRKAEFFDAKEKA